ncbi:hypothetical protein E6O75_ATG06171 [Venturia nashicola]|uniref:C2H2-type domain-containing protein n=1 Tax=Venturia nashicola TaxID=86259 RepID=A0A4Z1P4P6_9PEZI|nr:hypothetical protein E6O75_ATG06171 [Venturia nashicola]
MKHIANMTEKILDRDRLASTTPIEIEDRSSPSSAASGENYALSPSPVRELSMEVLFPGPLTAQEDILSPSLGGIFQNKESHPLQSQTPMSLCPSTPNPLASPIDISSPSISGHSQDGETCSLPSTPTSPPQEKSPSTCSSPQEAPPNPVAITYHNFADIPAPPVHLFRYECKICGIHIFMPDLVPGHLLQHKHQSGDWLCTSCGKRYLKGRWGYTMLLMHLQGRGGSECNELIDLRAQYAYMFGEAGIMTTFGKGPSL